MLGSSSGARGWLALRWAIVSSAVGLVALGGCGRLGFDALAGDGGADSDPSDLGDSGEGAAACTFGPFSPPVKIFSSRDDDFGPSLSRDGLTLYWSTDRRGGVGSYDLWMATRSDLDASFSEPVNLGPDVNSSSSDDEPAISHDGLTLYFESTRGSGDRRRLWVATRSAPDQAFGSGCP